MSGVIVYTRPDGGISICRPVYPPGMLPEQVIERVRARDIPADATDVRVTAAQDAPIDRTFRDAWSNGAGPVGIDMAKARAIHLSRIREARDRELARLDVAFSRALGQKDQAKADQVEAQRQTLRDVPQTFDLSRATTPDQLKALWPEGIER